VHAEAQIHVTKAKKPCFCRWATSLDAFSALFNKGEDGPIPVAS